MESVSKTKLMSLLVRLNKIDQELYKLLSPNEKYPVQAEGWFFLDYYNVLNAVYYEYCGESEESYYGQFKTSRYDQKDQPVAWYKGKFYLNSDGSIKGPKGYSGFIPDCINDVILSHKLSPKRKLNLLNQMFEDLKNLKNK